MKKYKVYGLSKQGWKLLNTVSSKEVAIAISKIISPKVYTHYIIIEHDFDTDSDITIASGRIKNRDDYLER